MKILRVELWLIKKEIKDFYNNRCVNCNKNVGTIFDSKDRILIAKCGDKSNPCDLDIQIKVGRYDTINNIDNSENVLNIDNNYTFGKWNESEIWNDGRIEYHIKNGFLCDDYLLLDTIIDISWYYNNIQVFIKLLTFQVLIKMLTFQVLIKLLIFQVENIIAETQGHCFYSTWLQFENI